MRGFEVDTSIQIKEKMKIEYQIDYTTKKKINK